MIRFRMWVITFLIITSLTLSVPYAVLGQDSSPAFEFRVANAPVSLQVCNNFTVDIEINRLLDGVHMDHFQFRVWVDTQYMRIVDSKNYVADNGWSIDDEDDVFADRYLLQASGEDFDEDAIWATLTIHCEGAGSSEIFFDESFTYAWVSSANLPRTIVPVRVRQFEIASVGGVSPPVNKLEILTPYMALAGLIIAVSTVYIINRRKA